MTSMLHMPTLPIIVHNSSSGPSGPWTQSDTKFFISFWVVFTIIGLLSLLFEYLRYKRTESGHSFYKYVSDWEGTVMGIFFILSSVTIQVLYAICLLFYGVYSIL
jgi:hypothetical protein